MGAEHVRSRLPCTRHRAQAHQAVSPLDERPSRAHEPDDKDATTKVFHYPDLESLKAHVLAFVAAETSPNTSSAAMANTV